MNDIPSDIIGHISRFLDSQEYLNLSVVTKQDWIFKLRDLHRSSGLLSSIQMSPLGEYIKYFAEDFWMGGGGQSVCDCINELSCKLLETKKFSYLPHKKRDFGGEEFDMFEFDDNDELVDDDYECYSDEETWKDTLQCKKELKNILRTKYGDGHEDLVDSEFSVLRSSYTPKEPDDVLRMIKNEGGLFQRPYYMPSYNAKNFASSRHLETKTIIYYNEKICMLYRCRMKGRIRRTIKMSLTLRALVG